MAEPSKRPGDEATTFMSHLLELRNRIMRGGASILVVFLIAAPFANDLYEYLAAPLMGALPEGNSMISTEPHGPFFVPFKFAFAL
ncbi:MAG: twin-arginine translocase subunit TatC, partial [Pseudomonadota bacterium]|nr:twin-arginine translocase subunit TatC [Pseudomonadota bacterium]